MFDIQTKNSNFAALLEKGCQTTSKSEHDGYLKNQERI